jgi:predicted small lipoprotein YifL
VLDFAGIHVDVVYSVSMLPRYIVVIIIAGACILAGCGIKGPLKLPPGKTAPEPTGLPPGAVPPTTLPPKAPETTPGSEAPPAKDSTQ